MSSISLSSKGLSAIKEHEGFSAIVYDDQAGNPTIGYGHELKPGETYLQGITEAQATELLASDVARAESAVRQYVDVTLTQLQFDALVSFTYNVGMNAFRHSTLLRYINAGNYAAAADEFLKWNKVKKNGVLVSDPGLATRRCAERTIFLS